jgi:hypothetical protein
MTFTLMVHNTKSYHNNELYYQRQRFRQLG